jgi:hypothetical protein
MANIDLQPSTSGNTTGLHVHVPSGASAGHFNNLADFPNAAPSAASNSQRKAVKVSVQGTQGVFVRVANPA